MGPLSMPYDCSAKCLFPLVPLLPGCSLDDNGVEFPIGQIWSPGDPCELCICQVNDNLLAFSCFTWLSLCLPDRGRATASLASDSLLGRLEPTCSAFGGWLRAVELGGCLR